LRARFLNWGSYDTPTQEGWPFSSQLAYARRLREVGFSEQQAEGAAQALAAAMTDTLATKDDLREMQLRIDARFAQVDTRFDLLETRLAEQEKRNELRLDELSARFAAGLADLDRRMTLRMVAGIAVVSALVKLF
jgi:hypothetical protein